MGTLFKFQLRLKGAERTAAFLGRFGREARRSAVEVIEHSARRMRDRARALAHEESGRLRRGIGYKITRKGLRAVVRSEARYGAYHEYGTRRSPRVRHFYLAFDEEDPRFLRGMAAALGDRAIDRALGGGRP